MKKGLLLSGIFAFVLGISFFTKYVTGLTAPLLGYYLFRGKIVEAGNMPDAYFGIYSYVPYVLMGIGLLMIIISMLFRKKENAGLPKWRFKLPHFKTWKQRRTIVQIVVLVLVAVHIGLFVLGFTNLKTLCPFSTGGGIIHGVFGFGAVYWTIILVGTIFGGRFLCGWLCVFASLQERAENLLTVTGNKPKTKKHMHSGFIYFFAFLFWGSIIFNIILNINHLTFSIHGGEVGPLTDFWGYIAGVFTLIPLLMFFIYVWGSRFFCRNVCPIGGLLQLYSKFSFLRVKIDADKCDNCSTCSKNCQMDVNIDKYIAAGNTSIKDGNCIVCGYCIDNCPKKALSFGLA
jgi:ferredoxin-type protein NapH